MNKTLRRTLFGLLMLIAGAVGLQAQEVMTASLNGSLVSTPDVFFTYDTSGKFNFNTKFTGATFDGISFTSGLKMEGNTKLMFTTTKVAKVEIVQSTWSDKTIKLDGTELAVADATAGEGYRLYTIDDVAAGEHAITRGSGENGLFYIRVTYPAEEEPAEITPLLTLTFPTYNDTGVSSYTSEWTATVDGNVWTLNGFNNNNNDAAWTFVRCGRKNNAHTATITSPAVNGIAKNVVYTVDKTSNIESVKFTTLNGNVVVSEADITEQFTAGNVTVNVEGAKGNSYMLTVNSTSANANGTTQISKVVINGVSAGDDPVATWRDIKIDLSNGNLTEESEEVQWQAVPAFGIAVAADGTVSRVATDATNAVATLSGNWHSNDHGWSAAQLVVPVQAGNYKISVSKSDFAGANSLTIKDAAGNETFIDAEGHRVTVYDTKGSRAEKLVFYYTAAEATTVTIKNNTYTNYVAIEAYDGEIPAEPVESTVTFAAGEGVGVVPVAITADKQATITLPVNFTLYAEGKTLTGWSDGTNTFAPGAEYTVPNDDVTLTAVFTTNEVSLDDRTDVVAITWDFQKQNGAPSVQWENNGDKTWVAQAVVNGVTIDVPLTIGTDGGKFNNSAWNDWCQINNDTKLTVPACKNAEISLYTMGDNSATTFGGAAGTYASNVNTYTYDGTDATLEIVINGGTYYRWAKVVLPVVENEPVDFTDHLVNPDFSSTEGWTPVLSGGYRDFGNGKIGTYQVYIAPSTADATHTADEYCLGFECRWQTNYSSAYQNTAALPAGTYRLTYDVENVNSTTTKANYQNLFTVTTANKVYTDQSTEWMNGKSSWTTHTIEFTVDIPGAVRVSFGYGTGSNNIGSNNTPALYVSHVKLVQLEEAVATEYSLNQPSADFLVNGNFDTANQGWALSNMGYQANQERPTRYVEKWQPSALTGSGYASQTLVAMPAGAYLLKATVHTNQAENGGTKLTIGNKDQNVSGAWKEYTVLYNNETDGADIPVSFSYNNAKSNWVAIDDFSVVYIGEYAKVENFFALQEEIAKAEALADQDAPMVGYLNEAIDAAKTVLAGTATAEELSAAVATLKQAEADYKAQNEPSAESTINMTEKVGTSPASWGVYGTAGGTVTTSIGTTAAPAEIYASASVGTKLQQTITGLENGTYIVKVFATSHNARGEDGAALDGTADDVAYVFANDVKTWITASGVTPGFVEGELTTPVIIDNVAVTDGTLTIGLNVDKAGQTGWHTIQIYELGQYAPAKIAYQAKRADLNTAITDANTNYTALTNGQDEFAQAIADAQGVYDSNKVTVAQVDEAIAAIRAAVKALIAANPAEIAEGSYYIKNNNGLYLAAGANWGTHAVVNADGLDYNVALADGKYTLDSQVSNGGNSHFLNGEWNDGAAFGWSVYKVSADQVVIGNGTQYLTAADNNEVGLVADITDAAKWTFIAAEDMLAAKMAALEAATAETPVDATFLLKGANFSRNDLRNNAWIVTRNGGNMTIGGPSANRATYGCELWNNTFDVHQDLADLPQGVYEFRIDGYSTNGTGYVYANEAVAPFTFQTSAANFATALDNIGNGQFSYNTSGQVIVFDGNLTVGLKRDVNSSADWTVFDNARLVYYGNDLSFYEQLYAEALAEAKAVSGKMSNTERDALDAAINAEFDHESREALYQATADLKAATAAALAAIAAYEDAGKVFPIVDKVLANTNVYTPETYRAFKVNYEAQRRAYKAGEMTLEEAQSLKPTILGNGYKAENTIDELLLSAWKANGEQCTNYDKALYINTWSVEGDTDGTEFKAPFFEYFGNQANEFVATMSNVEPGVYDVTAWVRVRATSDDVPTGVTFQANSDEAINVCDGEFNNNSGNKFYLKKVETQTTVAENGELTLAFKVAAENTIDWLSFKDVMFTMNVQATADAEKAAQMAQANDQVNEAKDELAEAIAAAKETLATGNVRYPSAAALSEAIDAAQAAIDGTGELTKLTQLNGTLRDLTAALDELTQADEDANADMMVDHVIYYWPQDASQANEITLAEGVTVAITGNIEKKIQNASKITLFDGKQYTTMKVSNGSQNTLTTTKPVKSITFYSYINKKAADTVRDSYWKEVAGVSYDAETSGGLMSLRSDGNLAKPEGRYFELAEPTTTVTFTNTGEQLCYVMDVEYADVTVGIDELTAGRTFSNETIYNLQGQKVDQPVRGGLYIIGGRKVVVK